jgi:hypothetical protein
MTANNPLIFESIYMKSIFENRDYKAATEQLTQLCEGHAAAVFEESALLAQLNDQPDSKPSALDRAKAMLTGGTPAPRQDRDGLGFRLTECRERLALLGAAITEQRGIMAGLVSAQSAIANIEAKQAHTKAAQGIKTALAGLRDAMEVEQGIRAEIVAGGYQCSLEVMARPELNFDDSQTTIARFTRDVDSYLTLHELGASKSVNVRLLFGTGDMQPGDVVTMTGHEAAALVRAGHAEQTRDKPSRVTRPVRESYGQCMETALS